MEEEEGPVNKEENNADIKILYEAGHRCMKVGYVCPRMGVAFIEWCMKKECIGE